MVQWQSFWSNYLGDIYWVVVSNIFYFHPYLGKISNLTNIFQMGWNHRVYKLVFHWIMIRGTVVDVGSFWRRHSVFLCTSHDWCNSTHFVQQGGPIGLIDTSQTCTLWKKTGGFRCFQFFLEPLSLIDDLMSQPSQDITIRHSLY